MWQIDDVDDVGLSANDRRWKYLLRVTEKLSEGEVELEDLVREVQKNKSRNEADHVLDHGILNDNENNVVPGVETTQKIGKNKSGLKITLKINPGKVVCNEGAVSRKHSNEALETSTARERIMYVDRNPSSTDNRRMGFACNEKGGTSEKRAKKRIEFVEEPGPVLPETVKNYILNTGGCLESVVFVIQKELYRTDVSRNHGRLSIPHGKIKNQFLTSAEVDLLDSCRILVNLVEPNLKECKMSLRNWKSNSMYALVSDWNEVCIRNQLKQEVIVQLWSFRRKSDLCFALVRIS